MTRVKTLVLGASGMLGNAVFRSFHADGNQNVTATVRSRTALSHFPADLQRRIITDVDVLDQDTLVELLSRTRPDVIINCVGLIKQFSSSSDPLIALPLNALFPHRLARVAALIGARLIHVSTDCVFSGKDGNYTEYSVADATDLYGVSKHLGETVEYENAVTLRTSIIGRELASANSLIDWFLAQQGSVKGYTKAIFSGLPTVELAAIIKDVVIPARELKGLYHVSAKAISKYELLHLIAKQYGKDTQIIADDKVQIDRSLNSNRFSQATGYVAPAWPDLIKRMHDTDPRRGN